MTCTSVSAVTAASAVYATTATTWLRSISSVRSCVARTATSSIYGCPASTIIRSFSSSSSSTISDLLIGTDITIAGDTFTDLTGSNLINVGGLLSVDLTGTTTDALSEGSTNLYYTADRVAAVIAGTTTDALSEGSTNLYFTDPRFNDRFDLRITATTTLPSITTLTGLTTFGSSGATTTSTGGLRIDNLGFTIDSLANCDTIDTDSTGAFLCGSDSDTTQDHTFPFTTTDEGENATSTILSFLGGFTSTASSTIVSTTFLASGDVGIGTSSPYAKLSITGISGQANPLFQIASSTETSFLTVSNLGALDLSSGATTTADNGLDISAGCP